jgi:trimethylamine--corrinoid protein Co-methyltransferase
MKQVSFSSQAETLALDLTHEIGPQGVFIASEHTVKYFRNQEFFDPKAVDRNARNIWEGNGSLDARERAREIAKNIIATHHPEPFSQELDQEIRENLKFSSN